MEEECKGSSGCPDEEEQPTEGPKEEVQEETTEEAPAEEPTEEAPSEEQPTEEAPAEEEAPSEEQPAEEAPAEEETPSEEPAAEEPKAEGAECACGIEETRNAEDMIRDLVNLINVYKEEEMQDVTTKIEPNTAAELVAKLEELAKKVGEICVCK